MRQPDKHGKVYKRRTRHERKGNESVNKGIDRPDSPFVPTLVAAKPDAEVATEIRNEVETKLGEFCSILNKAKDAGFFVSFGIGPDYRGAFVLNQLIVAKHF